MRKSEVTILPIFYKVKPSEVRWAAKENHGPYAQWLRGHEEKERYDSTTIQNWRDVLSDVSEISGFELEACNGEEEELLREVVTSVFKDFPSLRYHVFLDHRGPDSKTTLASQLYDRLTSRGLRVFLDKPELVEGVKIDCQIEVAIQFAVVHIAIFSPNYAQSSWCLDELHLMTKSGAIILPDFYKAKFSILDEEYAKALVDKENSGRYKSDDIQRWRRAISEVAKMKCNFEMDGNEEELLDEIVQTVLKNVLERSQVVDNSEVQSVVKGVLKESVPRSSEVVVEIDPEGYFGLEEKLIGFEKAVLWQDNERVEAKVVGVVGAAGIGKTALANLFFKRTRKYYKEYVFLSYVNGKGFTISPDHLHSDLIERLKHTDSNKCIMLLKHNISFCHALIILDDAAQLDVFLGIKSVLHPKSLILVISRDKDLLKRSGIVDSSIYHLAGLSRAHSQKLFCFYAFGQPYPQPEFADLVDEFLTACDGLPQSLKAFGGLLCGENRSLWLERLSGIGPFVQEEQQIYDSLNEEEQQIFLDIACFFIGEDRDTTARICGLVSFTSLELTWIVEVDRENKIKMRPFLGDFGRNIAKGLTPRRLWHQTTNNINDLLEQSSSVLSQFRGITMIPGDDFREHSNENEACLPSEITYYIRSCEVFHGPKNLKFLAAQDGYVEQILRRVGSPGLIWLQWYTCPYSYLPSWIPMENLRVSEVAGSELTELWQPESQDPLQLQELNIFAPLSVFPKSIGQLKHLEKIVVKCFNDRPLPLRTLPEEFCHLLSLNYLELRNCSRMMSLPDSFGRLTNLQYIDLKGASSLQMLPSTFGKLSLLKHLCLKDCLEVQKLSGVEHLTSLETLDVRGCQKLQSIPGLGKLTKLRTLYLEECREIQGLPSVERLTSLKKLNVIGCGEIQEFPGVELLTSLETLKVKGCQKLQSIPGLGQLTKLRTLCVQECREMQQLSGAEYFTSLKTLSVVRCDKLHSIPGLGQLTKIRTLNVSGCREIKELPGVEHLTSLERLDVRKCQKLQSIPGLGLHTKLQKLYVISCREIQDLRGLEYLTSLETLYVMKCNKLQSIPGLGQATKLNTVNVSGCREIKELPGMEHVTSLETLDASGCEKFKSIQGLGQLTKLQTLNLSGCREIQELPGVEHFTSLDKLFVGRCRKLQNIPAFGQLTKLTELDVGGCSEILELPSVEHLMSLRTLRVGDCEKLQSIRGLGQLTKLGTLDVSGCSGLLELPSVEHLTSLETLGVRRCKKLQRIPGLRRLRKLLTLDVTGCRHIRELSGVEHLTSLLKLDVTGCEKLQRIPRLGQLGKLGTLTISGCCEIRKLPCMKQLTSLETLNVRDCEKLESIQGLGHLTKLRTLMVLERPQIQELRGVEYVMSLEMLKVDGCPRMQWGSGVLQQLGQRLKEGLLV